MSAKLNRFGARSGICSGRVKAAAITAAMGEVERQVGTASPPSPTKAGEDLGRRGCHPHQSQAGWDSRHHPLVRAAEQLRTAVSGLEFSTPVAHVYNPLDYAWAPHAEYLRRYGHGPKKVVFLGMNPGPFGMAQTGVPFGEVAAVRDWLKVVGAVKRPEREHPRRPITGFECHRSEVSGKRLWGLFAERFGTAERFFSEHMVLNYCPLVFVEESGRNRTPDKLSPSEKGALFVACDRHLRDSVAALQPEWLVAVGDFAFRQAQAVFQNCAPRVGRILHPSPASPAANRDWAAVATRQLVELGIWK